MATTSFFRGSRRRDRRGRAGVDLHRRCGYLGSAGRVHALAGAPRADLIGGVQSVFVVGSVIAALALLIVFALPELELRGAPSPAAASPSGPSASQTPAAAHQRLSTRRSSDATPF